MSTLWYSDMNNILYINACCRENSRTDELAQQLLSCLNGSVQTVNLFDENICPLNAKLLSKRDDLLKNGRTGWVYGRYLKVTGSVSTGASTGVKVSGKVEIAPGSCAFLVV